MKNKNKGKKYYFYGFSSSNGKHKCLFAPAVNEKYFGLTMLLCPNCGKSICDE